MVRKFICYSVFLIEMLSISYVVYEILFGITNRVLGDIALFVSVFNIYTMLFAVILYGAPNNYYKDYIIKHISYNEIFRNNYEITVIYIDGIWEYYYRNKCYKFDLRGWPNIKKRVSDIIFIQYHDDFCNGNNIQNKNYTKNYFKENDIKIKFIKNNKIHIKKFKPSWILKLKMIISISHFHGKYYGDNVRKRNIEQTFLLLSPFQKEKNK